MLAEWRVEEFPRQAGFTGKHGLFAVILKA